MSEIENSENMSQQREDQSERKGASNFLGCAA